MICTKLELANLSDGGEEDEDELTMVMEREWEGGGDWTVRESGRGEDVRQKTNDKSLKGFLLIW